ncbi:RING finger protein [Flavobacteriaceae bacterium]|nr:RING finger protein [Flavobacteriaceae bacterium]
MTTKTIQCPWWDVIKPDCCENCGNYVTHIGSTKQEHPQSIRCWKFYNKESDCYKNPNKATYAQLRKRSRIIRNPDVGNPKKECSICLKMMGGTYVKRVPCGHTFHVKCLKEWETKKLSCPLCRYQYGEGPTIIQLTENFNNHLQEFKKLYWDIFELLIKEERAARLANSYPDIKLTGEMYDLYDDLMDEYDDIQVIIFSINRKNGPIPLRYRYVLKTFFIMCEIFENDEERVVVEGQLSPEQLYDRSGINEEGLVWCNTENLNNDQAQTVRDHAHAFLL